MIVYRTWHRKTSKHFLRWDGWFLFGLIPLYLRQVQYIEINN